MDLGLAVSVLQCHYNLKIWGGNLGEAHTFRKWKNHVFKLPGVKKGTSLLTTKEQSFLKVRYAHGYTRSCDRLCGTSASHSLVTWKVWKVVYIIAKHNIAYAEIFHPIWLSAPPVPLDFSVLYRFKHDTPSFTRKKLMELQWAQSSLCMPKTTGVHLFIMYVVWVETHHYILGCSDISVLNLNYPSLPQANIVVEWVFHSLGTWLQILPFFSCLSYYHLGLSYSVIHYQWKGEY